MPNTLVALAFCSLAIGVTRGLQCYMCDNEHSNSLCASEQNLLNCELNFDTCQTIVGYSDVSEKLSIIKTCTKNVSCHLQVDATLDTPCDTTTNDWICTSCCYDDGCNFSGAVALQPPLLVAPAIILLLSLNKVTLCYLSTDLCE